MQREKMDFDVIIIGAGPAGLSAAIRLGQLSAQKQIPLSICVIEKAESIGAQILSGAALDPRALNELIPDWQTKDFPLHTPITHDQFLFFTKTKSIRFPTPPQMRNDGNYIVSLELVCKWLAEQAESLGVNIFPGFAATEIIYENDKVCGVITGDKGRDKQGKETALFQPGMELLAKQTFFAEGCRGSLSQTLMQKYNLRKDKSPQTYGLGLKELWEVPTSQHQKGLVSHSFGWPLDHSTYGGSFVYHFGENLVSIGFVLGLDYKNPYLNPYEEFQLFKTHPSIKKILQNSKRLAYGARTLNEGGFQSIPTLTFPGGLLIGCAAGFLDVPKIKGIHNAMKSGMLAAESVFENLQEQTINSSECKTYARNIEKSWIWKELYKARNIRPAMNWGLFPGLCYAAMDTYILRGNAPWTFKYKHADNETLQPAQSAKPIEYPKHDNVYTFDLMTSVFLTNTAHDENQPCHLKLKKPEVMIDINFKKYASPETRYCPAGVYEIIYDENNTPRFHMNYPNCIQCKACDIKDPTQNIVWTPPEGGSGPQYEMM